MSDESPWPATDHASHLREPLLFQATQTMARLFFHWLFRHYCRLHALGPIPDPTSTPCIFTPTHFSHLDFWAVIDSLPATLRHRTFVLAAKDHFYEPIPRRWLTRFFSYHNLPFDRTHSSPADYRSLLARLQHGHSLLLFPQGSRSRDGQLQPFKPLAAMLALDAQCPLVPVILRGTFDALPPGRFWPRATPISVHFGEPLLPEKIVSPSSPLHVRAKRLTHILMTHIQTLWEQTAPTAQPPQRHSRS